MRFGFLGENRTPHPFFASAKTGRLLTFFSRRDTEKAGFWSGPDFFGSKKALFSSQKTPLLDPPKGGLKNAKKTFYFPVQFDGKWLKKAKKRGLFSRLRRGFFIKNRDPHQSGEVRVKRRFSLHTDSRLPVFPDYVGAFFS